MARRALTMDPATMWPQHCLAHVFAGEARIDEGIAEMQSFAPSWNGFNQYIIAHNWFHPATLYLANLRFDDTVAALRNHIWGFTPEIVVEHTDAILLCWYLELAGLQVDPAWRDIARHVGKNTSSVFPFLTTIYIYALARAGESARAHDTLAQMRRFADRQSGITAEVWQ